MLNNPKRNKARINKAKEVLEIITKYANKETLTKIEIAEYRDARKWYDKYCRRNGWTHA